MGGRSTGEGEGEGEGEGWRVGSITPGIKGGSMLDSTCLALEPIRVAGIVGALG